jgi:hypothetical protein
VQVKRLFVVAVFAAVDDFENTEEITGNARQLWNKYSPRADSGCMIHVKVRSPTERMESLDSGRIDVKMIEEKGSISLDEDNCGMYIVAHGYDLEHSACCLSPKAMAELVVYLKIKTLRKACLIICRGASHRRDEESPYGSKTYLVDFCEILGKLGLVPMIAGWERFITICRPGMPPVMKGRNGVEQIPVEELPSYYGKKVSQYKSGNVKPRLVRPPGSQSTYDINPDLHKMKFVYQFREGKVELVTEGWSDK